MSIRNLDALFRPRRVAVIGASHREGSVGTVVLRNLLEGGFEGPVMPVHPEYAEVQGVPVSPTIAELPEPPDLGVICTPPATVPGLVSELGAAGARAAVVLTAGMSRVPAEDGGTLEDAMLRAAREHQLRVLGPNCVGLLVPGIGLNASFAHTSALPGGIAFLSQSGGMCTAVLDWAKARGIGFSHFVSLGDSADVDVGDLLDHLGADPETHAILLYLEAIRDARKFLSAGRAAARTRYVLAIKAGRVEEGARAAASHTGALAGSDDVYDAAIARAGILRVFEIDELFGAVETLDRARPLRGDRLAILSNGGGPAVMATDYLAAEGGRLARLSDETKARLDAVLPETWSGANPVDIIGDARGERYATALTCLLEDPGVDGVLVLHVPVALVEPTEAARAVIEAIRESGSRRPVLTSWMGGDAVLEAREAFHEAGFPTYATPEHAVQGFLHLVRYRRNQELLMQTPAPLEEGGPPDVGDARETIEEAAREGREWLTEPEAKRVLAAYRIPVVRSEIARDPEEVSERAEALGLPVAVKILSPDVTHKTDVGGVALDIDTAEDAREAARTMRDRLARLRPSARLDGFLVQRMARRPAAHELIVGAATDPVFGPVVLFGQGGTAVEVIGDRAVALPPLNEALARALVGRTRVAKLLEGYRDRPPAKLEEILRTLVRVSNLIVDLPRVLELDVNPLLADDEGVLALDARIRIDVSEEGERPRPAIRPYPGHLAERVRLEEGREVLLRPIRPEDEPAHSAFHDSLAPEDIRFRHFGLVRELPHSALARYTQIDYDREMAFIATTEPSPDADAEEEPVTLGVVRGVFDPDNTRAEFAIIVRSSIQGLGLGRALLEKLIRYCRKRGTGEIVGHVLPDNRAMLGLARSLGFESHPDPEEGIVVVRLPLGSP